LKVKNTIGFVSLGKEGFLRFQLDDPSSYASFREESRGIECGSSSPTHFERLPAGGSSQRSVGRSSLGMYGCSRVVVLSPHFAAKPNL
jgi:hypothetical protein